MATIIGSGLESYLHRQARERALNYIAEAKEEAGKVIERAEKESQTLAEASSAKMQRTAIDRSRRALAQAQLKARMNLVRRREEVLQRLWDQVEQRLATYPQRPAEERYVILERLVLDAAAALPGGPLELAVSEPDRGLFSAHVLEDLSRRLRDAHGIPSVMLAERPEPIQGGVIVRRTDKNQLVDNSLDHRLALAKRTLHDDVVRLLVPAEDAGETPAP
ncbi:MAG: V-type ATP synthase subunit E [Anaerolineae bacterium]